MSADLITPGLLRVVGTVTGPQAVVIDATLLDRYATGVGVTAGELTDEARLGLYFTVFLRGTPAWQPVREQLPDSALDGGGKWTFVAAPAVGDVIMVRNEITGVEQKDGRRGPMVVLSTLTTWTDSDGRTQATCAGNAIFY